MPSKSSFFLGLAAATGLSAPLAAWAQAPSFACLNPPSVSSTPPGDTPITSQDGINCFVWQTFIGLNWRVDPAHPGQPDSAATPKDFGTPGTAQATTVWQTYANANSVFRPDGADPLPWGSSGKPWGSKPTPPSCASAKGKLRVMESNRMSAGINLSNETDQAFPRNNPNWLADKQGRLVYYELLMGQDEYNYILTHKLFNADGQAASISKGSNIAMPLGHDNPTVQGGLEIKAAWLDVDPKNPKWQSRFLLSNAQVYDETSNTCSQKTLALVGIHIVHKTASQPQWIWATFEHVDNAPDTAAVTNGSVKGDYTFYSDSCNVKAVPAGCKPKMNTSTGQPVTTTSCDMNQSPAYYLNGTACPPYPIQVSRDYAIKNTTDNHVASINSATQALIRQSNPTSVFANYQLVNVLWSSAAKNDNEPPGNPPLAPLSKSGETPSLSEVPVANTTLETFAQGFNCLSCHPSATIAPAAKKQLDNKPYASDYSFLFGMAEAKSLTKRKLVTGTKGKTQQKAMP